MEIVNARKKYEMIGVPHQIMLKGEIYCFKKQLMNNYLSYRCVHRQC